MSYKLLKGKKGIVFGAMNENSIAWKTAECIYKEGGRLLLTNTKLAIKLGNLNQLAKKINSEIIESDATNINDIENVFEKFLSIFNSKIDFILHSIGMSINIRKNIHYTNTNYNFLNKGWDISALSFHKIMKIAWNKNIMNKWGSIVALTYIASQRVFPEYNDMSDNKAYLESIARNFGYHWGIKNKVRVNTVSQSPTFTTAGMGIKNFDKFLKHSNDISPLGNASAKDCAKYIVTLFSDLTKKVTMQNLYHDGGFSKLGINNN